ncbi:sarcalumenin-like [Limulus polyphemus]|uniref:Sarcalumenin-like n=1 Tax=Limulus polyphemus TaxID=6850 RepID=A0ABM1B8X8_LIMPO|nr:sarcalumenin-like [Limulus polyphemus]
MAVIGTTLDWGFCLLLMVILVDISGVTSQEPTKNDIRAPNPPTHQECRLHIDAALRDYWDRQPPNPPIDKKTDDVGVDTSSHEEDILNSTNEEITDETEETGGEEDLDESSKEEEHENPSLRREETFDDEYNKESQSDENVEESEEQEIIEKLEDETGPWIVTKQEEESENIDSEKEYFEENVEKSEEGLHEAEKEVPPEAEESEEGLHEAEKEDPLEAEEALKEVSAEDEGEEEGSKEIVEKEEEGDKFRDKKSGGIEENKVEAEDAIIKTTVDQGALTDAEDEIASEENQVEDSRPDESEIDIPQETVITEEGTKDENAKDATFEGATDIEQELLSGVSSSEQTEITPQKDEETEEQDDEEMLAKKDEDEIDDDDEEEVFNPKRTLSRSRVHIDEILGVDEIGTKADKEEQELIQNILNELKKMYNSAIKPLENIYKYKEITTRQLGDAEIYSTPQVLFLGPWSSGKSSIINYLLGIERTPAARKEAPEPTDTDFTVITYGNEPQKLSGTELAADWSYASVQKFGQFFLDHFKGFRLNHPLLKKVTLLDTPGINENRRHQNRGYPFNEVFQWFIDHADAIYVVFDPFKLEIGSEMESILDQLKGREAQIRFILNKADTIRPSELMKVVGQLFWNLSPLMGSSEAPVIYAVSLMSKPFHSGTSANFLMDQEKALLNDLREIVDKRVENRISFARRHAVRVRNHAKMVDCYLATYYKHKGIFSNKKTVADDITEHPNQYNIYEGLSSLTNISRYDLPDPLVYRDFFRLHALYEFKPLASTCSYFMGCPLDKLDISIAYDLPELLGKYKKKSKSRIYEREEEADKGR